MKNTDTLTPDQILTVDPGDLHSGDLFRRGEIGDPAGSWPEMAAEFVGRTQLAYRVAPERTGVRVVGELSVTLRFACRRCLEPADAALQIDFDALYRPEGGESTPEEVVLELPAAGLLDLTALLREELLLAAPAWSVCRPGCRGLCPRCGVNRNLEDCGCAPVEDDPRWDALRALRGS
jgi:uncharacterized metal-binding protein YceD (DUF177 family)